MLMVDCFTFRTTASTRREFLMAAGKAALVLYSGLAVHTAGRASGQIPDQVREKLQKLTREGQDYYVAMKGNLMKQYDKGARLQKEVLTRHFDESRVNERLAEARKGYESLIPQFPYIGGEENDFTRYLMYPSGIMPTVRILQDEGVSLRKTGQMIFEISTAYYNAIAKPVKWYIGLTYFGEEKKAHMRAAAHKSQLHRYPGDWVFNFIEGQGKTFQYGLDITECGLVKFWSAQGLKEFTPYLCLTDWALWRAIGIEAMRTQTIANGATHCDFRYIGRGKDGPPGWPAESNPEWTGRYEIWQAFSDANRKYRFPSRGATGYEHS
jgi:hypothetical protein